jgi:type II secretory pathway pseudopilin PulG
VHEPASDFPASRESTARDAGFTLIEVIVAFTIFLAMVAACITILSSAQSATGDNSRRTTALNLAARELSITADAFGSEVRGPNTVETGTVTNPNPLPGGDEGEPLVVDDIGYTVTRRAIWTSVGSDAESTCDEGTTAELAYLRVRVTVTWPGGEDRPVRMTTILTPSKGTYYNDSDGHIGLKVIDRDGEPVAGQGVSVSGPESAADATDENGCVLFPFLTAGTYTIKLDDAGHVDIKGQAPSTTTAAVVAGQIWKGTVSYDQAASITATLKAPTGYLLPEGLTTTVTANKTPIPIMLGNSGLLPGGVAPAASTTGLATVVIRNLWPYLAGYEVWAGKCLDNDPEFPAYTGGVRPGPVITDPGGSAAVDVPLVGVSVRNTAGGARAVMAIQVPDSSCPSAGTFASAAYGGKVLVASALGGGATVKTSLPYGTWKLYAATSTTGTYTLRSTVTVTPSGVTPTTATVS